MYEPNIFQAHDSYVLSLAFSGDGNFLVSAGMDKLAKCWSTASWETVRIFKGHENSVNSLALTPDQRYLVTSSSDNTVRIWSFPEAELLHILQDRKKVVAGLTLSADGQWIAAASYGGRFMVWTIDGEPVVGVQASKKNVTSPAISPDRSCLAVGGLGDNITLWSLPSGESMGSLIGHKTAVSHIQFIDGGRTLVSLGYEQSIKFWDTESWQATRTVRSETEGVRGLMFSPDEKTAALSMESKVELWSVEDWQLKEELPISTKVVSAMAYSQDAKLIAIGGADKKVRIFENPI